MGARRTWSPCRGRRRWARKVAAEPSPGRASRTKRRPDARTIGLGCPASTPGGSTPKRTDGAPPQYVPLAVPVSVGRPRCVARSRIAFQASFDGSACEFSHRFTVETVTAIWCANSSCVMPSCWRRVRIRLRVLSGMRARLSNRRATRSGARPHGSTRRSPQQGGKKEAVATRSRRVTCARQQHLAMAGAMIYVHEVHEVLGGKMEEFGEAVRREWRPLVEDGDRARLLWFWQLTHGTGASYQAVSITAVRDWATWGELVGDPRLQAWQRRGGARPRGGTAEGPPPAARAPPPEGDPAAPPPAPATPRPP